MCSNAVENFRNFSRQVKVREEGREGEPGTVRVSPANKILFPATCHRRPAGRDPTARRWSPRAKCIKTVCRDGRPYPIPSYYYPSRKFRRRDARGNRELYWFPLQTKHCFSITRRRRPAGRDPTARRWSPKAKGIKTVRRDG